ncbi:MAG: hypothetical protein AAF533_04015 [Acidobacteriota bacterium]
MALPEKAARLLAAFGVPGHTRIRIEDLYLVMGKEVMEVVADLVDELGMRPEELEPEHLRRVRPMLGKRYLERHFDEWLEGKPSKGFWRPRTGSEHSPGLTGPLGLLEGEDEDALPGRVAVIAREELGPDQPSPRGLLMLSRNSHSSGLSSIFTFDLLPSSQETALVLNDSVGRHHSLPGSFGQASGSLVGDDLAVLWEVQPNVYKPSQERNPDARGPFRRHRNWHLMVTLGALCWMRESGRRMIVLAGEGLQAAHEVDPDEPVGADVPMHHDRTIGRAASAMGLERVELDEEVDVDSVAAAISPVLRREVDSGRELFFELR